MMAFNKSNPFPVFNFQVEVEGLIVGSFSEVSGLGAEIDIEEYREGGVNEFVHKLLKNTKYGNLICRKGVTKSTVLYDWYKRIVIGNIERRMVTIILLDSQKIPIKNWSYINCIPINGKDLN